MRNVDENDENIKYDFSMHDLDSDSSAIEFKNSSKDVIDLIEIDTNLPNTINSPTAQIYSERKFENKQEDSDSKVDYLENMSKSMLQTIFYFLKSTNPLQWLFLMCFSLIITIICFIFDYILRLGLNFRLSACNSENTFFNLIIWVSTCLVLLLMATSAGYFISSDADGSGIPELKTVISGINIYRYFSVEAFVGKFLGLLCALVGGSSTGKVGPFVHLSAIVCSRLMKIKYFAKINSSTHTKNAMMMAASAAGITLALGTPMGGVFFSMEVTSSFYLISNLPFAFATAAMCTLFSKLLNYGSDKNILFKQPVQLTPISDSMILLDLFLFTVLGVICGIVGALLSTLVSKLVYIRRKSKIKYLNHRFYYCGIVAVIVSIITFIIKPLMVYDRDMLGYIFTKEFPKNLSELNHPNEGILFLALFFFKLLITVLCLGINIPAGIFAPFFMIGAYLGRFYGHFFKLFLTISEEPIYAMVGAASVMSGATHSISSAIIIFELTGQVSYIVPMLFTCLIANFTAQALAISFFDVILLMKNLPHLPSIKSKELYKLNAQNLMSKELYPILKNNFTCINSLEILTNIPRKYSFNVPIPVIDINGIIRYTVNSKKLAKYLFHLFENYKLNYDDEMQNKIASLINYLRKKVGNKHASFGVYLKYKFKKIFSNSKEKHLHKVNKIAEQAKMNDLLFQLKEDAVNDNMIMNSKIHCEDSLLNSDKSAFTIDTSLSCLKLQYLFTFLNVTHLFVYDNGSLSGVITKEDFVKQAMILENK